MNDTDRARSLPTMLLAALNGIPAIISGIFGAIALVAPASRAGIVGPETGDLLLYAWLYGVRAVVVSLAVLAVLVLDRQHYGVRVATVLALAGIVQLFDGVALVALGQAPMAIGPALSVVIHLGSAVLITRRQTVAV